MRLTAENKQDLALWTGVLAGPIAWALQFQINYSLVQTACDSGNKLALHLVTLAALLAVAGGAVAAWRIWKRLPEGSRDQGDAHQARARFMALSGLAMSAFFAVLIVATEIPNLVLRACD